MKKTILCAAVAAVLFSSCVGEPDVWDPTLPEEEMATVYFLVFIWPTSYNGIPIEKKTFHIKLPAGQADFVCDVKSEGYFRYYGENLEWSYTLAGGKDYIITFEISKGLFGVNVYGQSAMNESYAPKDENFIEFVPFKTTDLSK
jgi:hypothetical protein